MRVEKPGNFGDIFDLQFTIDGSDMTQFLLEARIYQDIYTPAWTAIISIEDSSNMVMNLPITPGSTVELYIETKDASPATDGKQTFKFVIYKMDDRSGQGQMHQRFSIYCTSSALIDNMKKRVSKAYTQQKIEDIVDDILGEYLSGSLGEKDGTDLNYDIIIPNWSPMTAVSWLAKIAMSESVISDYTFFMKSEGEFWFKSFEKLYTGPVIGDGEVIFTQHPTNFRQEGDFKEVDYGVMINKYHFENYDHMASLGAGMFKNKLLCFNMIEKTWTETTFEYGEDVPDDSKNSAFAGTNLFAEAEDSNITYYPTHPGLFNPDNYSSTDFVDKWHGSRLTNMLKHEQEKLIIQIPGGGQAATWLGINAFIALPSHQDLDESTEIDKQYRGEFLVSHIFHYITQDHYTVNMECLKKRLAEPFGSGDE